MSQGEATRIDRIDGSAIPLRGDNVDTDRIIPARFLKAITFEGLGEHVFEDDRLASPDHPFSNPTFGDASILLVNENFGSGSSREHAPQALQRWGIKACVGESFSEIFQGNSLMIGLPCATVSKDEVEFLMNLAEQQPGTPMVLSLGPLTIEAGGRSSDVQMPDAVRESLMEGRWDATGSLLDQYEEVRAVAKRLPYLQGFSRT